MQIEYEATFLDINKNEIRKQLKKIGAKLVKPEFLQKRYAFDLPSGYDGHRWARVRDEQDKITMSFKDIDGNKIENQKEINLIIDDFEKGVEFLEAIGCIKKSYQENKREIWVLDNIEICIDEWPFIEPFVEIEGKSEQNVKNVSEKLGFDYSKAMFGSTSLIIHNKYGISFDTIDHIPKITFNMENPFLKYKKI
jgi:adenylate cyclase class 2